MRTTTLLLVFSAVLYTAYAASCTVHCDKNAGGDCGCTDSNCGGDYCAGGCGLPCYAECKTGGGKNGRKYGDCGYGARAGVDCGGQTYCGWCDCSSTDGHVDGVLNECCRFDCTECANLLTGCPADRVTCMADCVPNADGDWSNCCYCDCSDGDACTVNVFADGECKKSAACAAPANSCRENKCTAGSGGEGDFSCAEADKAEGAPCDGPDQCTVGTCLSGACGKFGARNCAPNDCENWLCSTETGCYRDESNPWKEDLTPCDDGKPCTVGDLCIAGECTPGDSCPSGQVCTDKGCTSNLLIWYGLVGAAAAAVCCASGAAVLMNRRNAEDEEWAKMSSGSSYGNKRMTTATQMSSFTRGSGGSRSSRSSKGKRMTGVTQMSGASRGAMMGLDGVSAGTRNTMGTTHSQMSRATRSTSGSRNSRSSKHSRSSKGRSHASGGTRSSTGSRSSRSRGSRGRH